MGLLLSLFFSESEMALIKENLTNPPVDRQSLSLTSLIYYDDNHWSLWLNNKLFRPENVDELDDYELEKITPGGAHFFCHLNQKSFLLHPHQVYMPFEEKILDRGEISVSFKEQK